MYSSEKVRLSQPYVAPQRPFTSHAIDDVETASLAYLDQYMPKLAEASKTVKALTGNLVAEKLPSVFRALELERRRIRKTLMNHAQRDIFDELTHPLQTAELDRLSAYAAEEIESYSRHSLETRLDGLISESLPAQIDGGSYNEIATAGLAMIVEHYKTRRGAETDMFQTQLRFMKRLASLCGLDNQEQKTEEVMPQDNHNPSG